MFYKLIKTFYYFLKNFFRDSIILLLLIEGFHSSGKTKFQKISFFDERAQIS